MAHFPKRRYSFKPSGFSTLPAIGPFADGGVVPNSSLSDVTLSTVVALTTTTRTAPLKLNHLTIASTGLYQAQTAYCIFVWANIVVMNKAPTSAGFASSGGSATNPFIDEGIIVVGGGGGSGGSGGGGGCADDMSGLVTLGGNGGSGGNGFTGDSRSAGGATVNPGSGGIGVANTYAAGFTYGNGGAGGSTSLDSGGAGANGCGGGGAGGGTVNIGGEDAGGGGGGSGGLVVLVCNDLSGTGQFRARGGSPTIGTSTSGTPEDGGGGGGGVLWIAARKYTGTMTGDVAIVFFGATAGLAQIFEIKRDNTYVLRSFANSWNNL